MVSSSGAVNLLIRCAVMLSVAIFSSSAISQAGSTVLQLKETAILTPAVKYFSFTPESSITYIPGQFINIHFISSAGEPMESSYSIATIYGSNNNIELAVKEVPTGEGANYLYSLQLGDQLTMSGPYGTFILPEKDPARYVLVATGTGVSPYRSMIGLLEERLIDSSLSLRILFGVSSREDSFFVEDFIRLSEKYPGQVELIVTYSHTYPAEPQPYEYQGYVTQYLDGLSPDSDLVYLCGNPGMISDAIAILEAQGFNETNIIRE